MHVLDTTIQGTGSNNVAVQSESDEASVKEEKGEEKRTGDGVSVSSSADGADTAIARRELSCNGNTSPLSPLSTLAPQSLMLDMGQYF
ncbi:hypothetical protein BLNAU_21155 [Blattamonas nauphoetae]|uniref:Uncharacterized protein n=1 Tax=Blattamonas nauphoetae TaxID=2049346 RepID=A0ABQ9X0T4_9EUKA|nr:hypothetical protein BLNAU_21155 [Blattamonas nauphoetae]